jgi:hypothetical protein
VGLAWDRSEPSESHFGEGYLQGVNARIQAAHHAGFLVILDPGTQYAPNWVFSLQGGTRFVDQYGNVSTGPPSSGDDVANAVTDLSVRAAVGAYLAGLGQRLDLTDILAVREGGGPFGELRYPGATYEGHTDCHWAGDASSQGASVLKYRPGARNPRAAAAFLASYNADLRTFAD